MYLQYGIKHKNPLGITMLICGCAAILEFFAFPATGILDNVDSYALALSIASIVSLLPAVVVLTWTIVLFIKTKRRGYSFTWSNWVGIVLAIITCIIWLMSLIFDPCWPDSGWPYSGWPTGRWW